MKSYLPKPTVGLIAGLLLFSGCDIKDQPLELSDLTAGERLYFERVVAVERAKSVTMVYRATGEALLDSLATAWGDSAQADVLKGLGGDPYHATAISELLGRVVKAEQDSLLWDPGFNRLNLPLPDPNRPGRTRITNDPVEAATD